MGALVLIIDDDDCLRTLGAAVLTRAGYSVATACDGLEGLRKIAELGPALVVLDMNMPHFDGLDVLARMETPRPPVIVWSGESELEHAARAFGADAFLRKPVSLLDLVDAAAGLLGQRSIAA